LRAKRKFWAHNIQTYRLVDGRFEFKDHEKELLMQKKLELQK
jgi:hypothetical protein